MTHLQSQVMRTIADAKAGEISGHSIAMWLNSSRDPSGVYSSLRSLVKKGWVKEEVKDYWPNGNFPKTNLSMFSLTEEGRKQKL